MRLAVCLVLILLFAACGTATPAPTATATEDASDLSATSEVGVLSMTIEVPIPGTVMPGLSNMPTGGRPTIAFETVYFTRSGGIAGQTLNLQLEADGTLTRNDETISVPETTVAEVNDRLNRIDFYGLQGVFTGPVSPDAFSYDLTVESNVGSRTISAQDGFIPPELLDLFNFISQLGL
jgi:hypothetical protein